MITNYREIRLLARRYRKKYGKLSARQLCRELGILLNPMPLGTEKGCIKGFIQRNSRICTITINTNLPEQLQEFIILHEIGHYAAGHLNDVVCTFPDFEIGYDVRSKTLTAQQENAANFFAAEYYLDDEETCEAVKSYPFATAAFALSVPLEFLEFKCMMLKREGLIEGESLYSVCSDCLAKVEF